MSLLVLLVNPVQAANPNCNEVDGDYIVSFAKGANLANELKAAPGKAIAPKFTYRSALNGFAATLSAEQACAFKKRPGAIVERDTEAFASGKPAPSGTTNWYSWGLDRIDEKTLPLDNASLAAVTPSGAVNAYIIDTGIYRDHSQFGGRVSSSGFTAITDGRKTDDCNGHGTHVAGTVGGNDTGVDKLVRLIPVRVLNCRGSGSWSGVIAGIDWVKTTYLANPTPSVANMSLGGSPMTSVDTAVQNLIDAGVIVVVAAGNDGANACNYTPARVPSAITVGAVSLASSGTSESVASYSNTGNCVDIYAPGTNIKSAWIGNVNASNTISGTSMASPHVAGIVARYLEGGPKTLLDVNSGLAASSSTLNNSGSLKVACLINACTGS